MKYDCELTLSARELAVIWELLQNVRLGSRNEYEDAISNLCIDLEKSGIEARLNNFYSAYDLCPPKFKYEASNDEGVVINIE